MAAPCAQWQVAGLQEAAAKAENKKVAFAHRGKPVVLTLAELDVLRRRIDQKTRHSIMEQSAGSLSAGS